MSHSDEASVFILPFFIIGRLKLRRRQKIALCGVFSLGLITIATSLARFIVYTVTDYNVDDASGSKSWIVHLSIHTFGLSDDYQICGVQQKCVQQPSWYRYPPLKPLSFDRAHRTPLTAVPMATWLAL